MSSEEQFSIDYLRKIRSHLLPGKKWNVEPLSHNCRGNEWMNYSITHDVLFKIFGSKNKEEEEENTQDEITRRVQAHCHHLVSSLTRGDIQRDRVVGCLIGLTLGDAVGAPLEFSAVDTRSNRNPARQIYLEEQPVSDENGTLSLMYVNEFNTFRLHRGQWTDDASMALCLADSLLDRQGYDGGDCRTRFRMWWFFGYNSAFRFDPRPNRRSVGLGGNISKSLQEVNRFAGKSSDHVPPRFSEVGEDAGNGSMMRLGPLPIRYNSNVNEAVRQAIESSYATHPGTDAAACCAFLSFLQVKAIHRKGSLSIAKFLDTQISIFIKDFVKNSEFSGSSGFVKLEQLLRCKPLSRKEACWHWKKRRILLEETILARGDSYNGYPVSKGYFGSYCFDGLAMALWALYHSSNYADCILKVVNLLGDCDTTAAIAGQVAGAFYGYVSIEKTEMGKIFMRNLRSWDPFEEIALKALMLHEDAAGTSTLASIKNN